MWWTTYHDLLSLSKVVDRIRIQLHETNGLQRNKLLGDDLCGVQDIESKGESLIFVKDLGRKLPLGAVSRLNGIPKVGAVVVGVLASNVLRFIPHQAGFALLGLPVPLDELGVALISHQAEGMYTKAVLHMSALYSIKAQIPYHVSEDSRDAVTSHGPEQGM